MENIRLSSDWLYHFKHDIEIIKLILSSGFRHNHWPETIPYKGSSQMNFMVSFCDIRIEETDFHRNCYGDNCIVLTKEWGIQNGVSPVRYVHEGSPGIQQQYIQFKHRYREIRQIAKGDLDIAAQDYLLFSVLHRMGKLKYESLYENIDQNPSISTDVEVLEQEFIDFIESLQGIKKDIVFVKYLRALMLAVHELHDELEGRDAFMRAYIENFIHPHTGILYPGKVIYDEREWRSIRFPTNAELNTAIEQRFLPSDYNLKFSASDIVAILCSDKKGVDGIKSSIKKGSTLLKDEFSLDRVCLINDFKE
jgi:hypothetical protein